MIHIIVQDTLTTIQPVSRNYESTVPEGRPHRVTFEIMASDLQDILEISGQYVNYTDISICHTTDLTCIDFRKFRVLIPLDQKIVELLNVRVDWNATEDWSMSQYPPVKISGYIPNE